MLVLSENLLHPVASDSTQRVGVTGLLSYNFVENYCNVNMIQKYIFLIEDTLSLLNCTMVDQDSSSYNDGYKSIHYMIFYVCSFSF